MDRITAIGHGSPRDMPAAAALAVAAAATPAELGEEPTAAALSGLWPGDQVSVTPDDTGRDPVTGRLLSVTAHEIVLRREDARLAGVNAP